MNNRKCAVCGNEKYYAKGLCRACYTRMKNNNLNSIDELQKHDAKREQRHSLIEWKRNKIIAEQAKVRSTNEFYNRPSCEISKTVMDWYYYTTDKYLRMSFGTKRDRVSAYNTIYAMTKRRHNLPIKRHIEKNSIIIERIA